MNVDTVDWMTERRIPLMVLRTFDQRPCLFFPLLLLADEGGIARVAAVEEEKEEEEGRTMRSSSVPFWGTGP